jgi:hypothetical protein
VETNSRPSWPGCFHSYNVYKCGLFLKLAWVEVQSSDMLGDSGFPSSWLSTMGPTVKMWKTGSDLSPERSKAVVMSNYMEIQNVWKHVCTLLTCFLILYLPPTGCMSLGKKIVTLCLGFVLLLFFRCKIKWHIPEILLRRLNRSYVHLGWTELTRAWIQGRNPNT